MDPDFLRDTLLSLAGGLPLTLKLAVSAVACGGVLGLMLALARLYGGLLPGGIARLYVFVFRGTPLLVQIFLIYYGLGQIREIRASLLWPFLRDPYWCAVLALTLNTAAYASEIIRGGVLSVPHGQIEAARAYGMTRGLTFRRIVMPVAIRQALPGYGNEIISMVKATSLTSIITLMEVSGIAAKIIAETYRALEVFIVAGSLYLSINFILTRLIVTLEYRLTPHLRPQPGGR